MYVVHVPRVGSVLFEHILLFLFFLFYNLSFHCGICMAMSTKEKWKDVVRHVRREECRN